MTDASGQRQRAEAALNINDRVRVSGTRYVRVIESFLPDVDGGVKLNKPVNGFLYWNVRDLRRLDRLAREGVKGG